jgi:hypothetical protein
MAKLNKQTSGIIAASSIVMAATLIAGVALAAGDLVYGDADGKWQKADADATATSSEKRLHIVLRPAAAGTVVTAVAKGNLEGFDLSGLNVGDKLYASGTAGEIADAAAAIQVCIGEVEATHTTTTVDKILAVDCPAPRPVIASASQAAATDPASTQALANALRSALIAIGAIKGAA